MSAASVSHAAPAFCGRNIQNLDRMVSGELQQFNIQGGDKGAINDCVHTLLNAGTGWNYAIASDACNLAGSWPDDGTTRLCPTGPTKAEVRTCLNPAARKSTQGADAACKRWGI